MYTMPYFMTNPDWYISPYEDEGELNITDEEKRYQLTDKAPQEAIDSYNAYYNAIEEQRNKFEAAGLEIDF